MIGLRMMLVLVVSPNFQRGSLRRLTGALSFAKVLSAFRLSAGAGETPLFL